MISSLELKLEQVDVEPIEVDDQAEEVLGFFNWFLLTSRQSN